MNADFGKKLANSKRKRKNPRPDENGNSGSIKKIVKSSFFGIIIGLAVGFALMLLFNIIAFGRENPSAFVAPFALASLFSSAFVCGFCSAKNNGREYILCGIISGTIYVLIIFLISLFIHRAGDTGTKLLPSIITRLIVLASSIAGGFLASKKKAATGHKHRK